MDKTNKISLFNGLKKNFGKSDKKNKDIIVTRNFPSLYKISSQETRGMKHIDIIKINSKSFLPKKYQQFLNDLHNVMNFIRINILSANKNSTRDTVNVIKDKLNFLSKSFKCSQWYVLVINVIELKL